MDGIYEIEVEADEADLIRVVAKAAVKEARKAQLELDGHDLAERLMKNFEKGERDFTRLKALVLGAEKAQVGPGSWHAN